MNEMYGLLFTLALGLFIVIGAIIVFLTKNNNKFLEFSISLAFGVMVMLIITDLIPEAYEHMEMDRSKTEAIFLVIGFSLLGFLALKVLDLFVPDHDEHTVGKEDIKHLNHIGLVSSIALILHNIIEGMAIYTTVLNSFKAGIFMSIGVGLHNIPLGMAITSAFDKGSPSRKKTFLWLSMISISTFFGGIVTMLLSHFINDLLLGILLSVTLGMLLYISFMELLPKVIHSKERKISCLGILLGVVILLIAYFI